MDIGVRCLLFNSLATVNYPLRDCRYHRFWAKRFARINIVGFNVRYKLSICFFFFYFDSSIIWVEGSVSTCLSIFNCNYVSSFHTNSLMAATFISTLFQHGGARWSACRGMRDSPLGKIIAAY